MPSDSTCVPASAVPELTGPRVGAVPLRRAGGEAPTYLMVWPVPVGQAGCAGLSETARLPAPCTQPRRLPQSGRQATSGLPELGGQGPGWQGRGACLPSEDQGPWWWNAQVSPSSSHSQRLHGLGAGTRPPPSSLVDRRDDGSIRGREAPEAYPK